MSIPGRDNVVTQSCYQFLLNASDQCAINTLERFNRNNRVTHVMQHSLQVQNVEGRVNTHGYLCWL